MRKISIFFILILLIYCCPMAMSYETSNLSVNAVVETTHMDAADEDNQQINSDEGYGPQDEEYYGAEGNNAEN